MIKNIFVNMEDKMKKVVNTALAPTPVGPYNQAIVVENLVFTAGQIAINPETGELEPNNIRIQTSRVITNLQAVLEAAGSDLSRVIKTTVFLKNMDDFSEMNEVYAKFFTEKAPARSAVQVSRLPKDVLVEIECVAYKK
jgi:2-iminobutanoate/2-iminopropanoate deaminase